MDVLQPVQIDRTEMIGDELETAVIGRGNCWLRELVHADEPLRGDEWLDDRVAPLAMSDGVDVRFSPRQPAILLQTLDHSRTRAGDRQSREWTGARHSLCRRCS